MVAFRLLKTLVGTVSMFPFLVFNPEENYLSKKQMSIKKLNYTVITLSEKLVI